MRARDDAADRSTLFAIAAGVLAIACRRTRARVRYALWQLGLRLEPVLSRE